MGLLATHPGSTMARWIVPGKKAYALAGIGLLPRYPGIDVMSDINLGAPGIDP
jgi:hypothetical protein